MPVVGDRGRVGTFGRPFCSFRYNTFCSSSGIIYFNRMLNACKVGFFVLSIMLAIGRMNAYKILHSAPSKMIKVNEINALLKSRCLKRIGGNALHPISSKLFSTQTGGDTGFGGKVSFFVFY